MYTIEQFKTYLSNVDSLGDAIYYLNQIDKILEKAKEEKLQEDTNDADNIWIEPKQ